MHTDSGVSEPDGADGAVQAACQAMQRSCHVCTAVAATLRSGVVVPWCTL